MDKSKIYSKISKFLSRLVDTRAAGLYIILFAASIGIATFIENDYGTSSAQKVIFKSLWFELLLFLFAITLVVNVYKFRMLQNKKWALLMFHLSMIIILLGAGITRYYGYEGIMHIRENDQSNSFLSAETYLLFEVVKDGREYQFDEPVLFATLGNNNFSESYQIGNDIIEIDVKNFIPNPIQELVSNDAGLPIIKVVFGGANGREEYYISKGETRRIKAVNYNFTNTYIPGAINIYYRNDSLLIKSEETLNQMVMATQTRDTLVPRETPYPLRLRSLYSFGQSSFVFGDFNPKGSVQIVSEHRKVKNESMTVLDMDVTINGSKKETYVFGKKGLPGRPAIIRDENLSLAISYGAKMKELPFKIKLYDFIMEKYPGTNSAASYASEVQLIDPTNNVEKDYRIYMNNILDYDGYRFFQASFDKDERGTYLSVNHDFVGTWVSYLGYALLTIGMIWLFLSKNTRFSMVSKKVKAISAKTTYAIILAFFASSVNPTYGQKNIAVKYNVVSAEHANQFSQIIVQDHKGRMKPIHTLSRELLRKVSRKESFQGYNSDQVILSMFADKQSWLAAPIVKITEHKALQDLLGTKGKLAAYKNFFDKSGSYKLRDEVRRAYGLQPIDRAQYEKDLMKIDERVNILSMIFSGRILRLIPIPGDENNTWASSDGGHGSSSNRSAIAEKFYPSYQSALRKAVSTGDYSLPNQILTELDAFQRDEGKVVIPSNVQRKAEIALNNLNVFSRLSAYYSILGCLFLVMLFISVFRPDTNLKILYKILLGGVLLGFLFHTVGLGLRWYVSERAPWSNGYESMIYIAWTTTLAGIIFTRKSLGGLAATMILAGTILLVAMLSYLDPEITPLVPVLRSYWLTIHVSLIAGSYGFLMLGAIIGLINLILIVFINSINRKTIMDKVRELSYISELTLTGGLVMISIGTYLGGVWANESWGRYWGWDAKETWALVTILVYAFILHMRLIPKMKSLYAYNLATLFGFASVVMTYFGVNYYLSGLHSYAAGDPVPIPTWVYIAVVCVTIISILAYIRDRISIGKVSV